MDEIIKEALINYYKNTDNIDKYGQLNIFYMQAFYFIKDELLRNKVIEFIKEGKSKLVKFQTYGGRFGVYEAIAIIDNKLNSELSIALRSNETYKEKMRH